jgi:CDGSH-type Zn-finger protein
MTDPKIAAKKPEVLKLMPGTYWWCACGRSSGQPFCDGSHTGSRFRPVRFELEHSRSVTLCMCKRTKSPPYCDNSHTKL